MIDKKIASGLSAACRPQNAFGIQPQAPAAILIVFLSATILFMPLYFFVSGTGKYPGIIPSERLRFSVYGLRVITPKMQNA
ncbi:hypothetical protein HTY54_27360 [Escherichia coli]|nr:hypothetical protein [Escherichia coli]